MIKKLAFALIFAVALHLGAAAVFAGAVIPANTFFPRGTKKGALVCLNIFRQTKTPGSFFYEKDPATGRDTARLYYRLPNNRTGYVATWQGNPDSPFEGNVDRLKTLVNYTMMYWERPNARIHPE
ncbi:MAG: hypothetical protein LBU36_05880 [Clostridiales bacterium]|nr:hypothetical protein [Clostridiales bacterium]